MEEKSFKILSIDGGGIKGLYSARILEHLEDKYKCNASDYFDMICGTSTGGIIALLLSLKVPASEIAKFYMDKGPLIFPRKNKYMAIIKQALWKGKYSDKQFKIELEKVFNGSRIKDCNNLLCIPTYLYTEARPWIFKYDHKEHSLDRDKNALCVDVALSTSAAPTYFPLAQIPYYDNKQFVDGGVWANNPTLVGLIEALSYFVGNDKEFQKLKILSISSLSITGGQKIRKKRAMSFVDWRNDLFNLSMSGQSSFTHYFMNKIKENTNIDITYFRIPSANISSNQESLIQMDNASKDALDLISGKGNDQGEIYKKLPDIAVFFTEVKQYKIK